MRNALVSTTLALALVGTFLAQPALANEYIKISGSINDQSGCPETSFSNSPNLYHLYAYKGETLLSGQTISKSYFEVFVPKSTEVTISIGRNLDQTCKFFWGLKKSYESDEIINLTFPKMIKITGTVVDAQLNPLRYTLPKENVDLIAFVKIWEQWTRRKTLPSYLGTQYEWGSVMQEPTGISDQKGEFSIYLYPTSDVVSIQVEVRGGSITWRSAKQKIAENRNFLICMPLNFGTSRSFSPTCSKTLEEGEAADKAAADKAAADKAAADKAAADKAAADKAAADKAAADAKLLKTTFENYVATITRYKSLVSNLFRTYPEFFEQNLDLRTSLQRALDYKIPEIVSSEEVERMNKLISDDSAPGLATDIDLASTGIAKFIEDEKSNISKAKKTTIICTKGKITKKVTAVKPKCPTGYKVKK